MIKKIVVLIIMLLGFASCEKGGNSNNPFVGNWKCEDSRYEFSSNGTFTVHYHYYDNRGNMYSKSGSYSYNKQQQTLAMQYDSGTSRICIVQTCTYDKIVYFDPKDLYTWTLLRE